MNPIKNLSESHHDMLKIKFNNPVTLEDIKKFQSDYNIILPKDYINSMLECNGFEVIDKCYNMVLADFFTLNEVADRSELPYCADKSTLLQGIIKIAHFEDDHIVILDCRDNKSSVYAGDEIAPEEFVYLGNFTDFLEKVSLVNFSIYWDLIPEVKKHNFRDI